jgi:predicted dehydrogenase
MSVMAASPGPRFRMLGTTGAYVKYGLDVQEAALRAGGLPDAAEWGREPESSWGRIEVGGATETVVPTLPGSYSHFYSQMVQALRGERLPPVNPSESVRVLEIIEAARKSAREKRVIKLGKTL